MIKKLSISHDHAQIPGRLLSIMLTLKIISSQICLEKENRSQRFKNRFSAIKFVQNFDNLQGIQYLPIFLFLKKIMESEKKDHFCVNDLYEC